MRLNSTMRSFPNMRHKRSAFFAWMMVCVTVFSPLHFAVPRALAHGDDTDTELERLNKEKARAEARKAIAEARKAELDAKFPASKSDPLEGKTTKEGDFIEGQIMAYLSLSEAADQVANKLQSSVPVIQAIAVHSANDMGVLASYQVALKRLQSFSAEYGLVIGQENAALLATPVTAQPTPLPRPSGQGARQRSDSMAESSMLAPVMAATSALGSFSDFLSLLRTDVDLKGGIFDVTDDVLVNEVFRALRQKYPGIRLFYPQAVPQAINAVGLSPILNQVEGLYDQKVRADDAARQIEVRIVKKHAQVADIRQLNSDLQGVLENTLKPDNEWIAEMDKEVLALRKDGAVKNAAKILLKQATIAQVRLANSGVEAATIVTQTVNAGAISNLENDIEILNRGRRSHASVNARFELLLKELVKTEEDKGTSLIISYMQAESLTTALDATPNSYWLAIGVIKAGGNIKIQRNLIVDVFRGGSRVSHSGGAIVKFNLYNRVGISRLSGTSARYTKYKSSGDVEKLTR